MTPLTRAAAILLAAWLTNLQATDHLGEGFMLALEGGTAVPIERFGAGGDRILWLPSEEGIQGRPERALATALAEQGLDVWLVDPFACRPRSRAVISWS